MTPADAMREAKDMRGCVIRLRGSRMGYLAIPITIADLLNDEIGDDMKIICSYEEGQCILCS